MHALQLRDHSDQTVRTFFDLILPALLRLRCVPESGVLAFDVPCCSKPRVAIDFERRTTRVDARRADLTITIDVDDLAGVLEGRKNVVDGFRAGRIQVVGDLQLLDAFGALLESAR